MAKRAARQMEAETMTDRCEDRIAEHLSGRLEDFAALNTGMQSADDDAREQAMDEQMEYPLSVEVKRMVKVMLSWGGPSDWFEVTVDDDGDAERIEYHFADWFDHASRVLEGREYEAASQFLQGFTEIALLS